MARARGRWAGVIGLGIALGLVLAGVAVPDPARAGSVEIASQRWDASGGQWSGEHRRFSPGPYWGQGRDHRSWGDRRHGYWDRPGYWGRPGYWDHPGYRHPYGWSHGWWWGGAPVYVPGQWVWNGWNWVWVQGYWR